MTEPRRYQVKRYGWIPDLPDHRDALYAAPLPRRGLPVRVDLRRLMPPVYDQGQLGSCTANAIGAAVQFARAQEKKPDFIPSRLFIYYGERVIEGTVDQDSGAQIRDGMKVVAKLGACPESATGKPYDWPYDIARFAVAPPKPCHVFALKNQVILYKRVPRAVAQMKGCLAEGFPWVLGFTVYEGFESPEVAKTGVLQMPGRNEKVLGGHAVLAVGYDDRQQRFIVRNSWGRGWGLRGYFTMPYAYLLDEHLSDDFWTVRVTE
ncbi:MAG TPA: C1 family peptidase [Anaeromyxobacter sp.]|nr:C1 family peptidase [Anaeromyxobacter sp.]